jgi:murein DD-endopeptidase MepM/ murein hydrolase activator NlpD
MLTILSSAITSLSTKTRLIRLSTVLAIASMMTTGCSSISSDQESNSDLVEIEAPCEIRYGLPIDSFVMVEGEVGKNQFLADILLPHQVAYNLIERMAQDIDLFDFRRMRAGNPYTVLLGADSTAKYFVYEENKVDYLVWSFEGDSVAGYRGSKPVERRISEVAGIITNSLYQSLVDGGASAELAVKLADIYAWSIDFYKIQQGDRFKVVYGERFVDNESVGVDSIYAASFDYRGRAFEAYRFDQNGKTGYFDREGNSLKRAFLQAPLNYSRISSRYSQRRFHPVQKRYKAHLGTDYAAPTGTPIHSTGDGVVIAAAYTSGNGNYVKIKHNETYTTQYLHMSKFAAGMRAGKAVKQGDVIGYVGSTGLATGPHCCYRFWKNGQQVDPFMEKMPASFPIEDKNKAAFRQVQEKWTQALEGIPYPEAPELPVAEPELDLASTF